MKDENYKLQLVGKFFHSFNNDEFKTVCWQGKITTYLGDNWYMINIYEWITGIDYTTKIINLFDMKDFEFYENKKEMADIYEYKLKSRTERKTNKELNECRKGKHFT
jgi:hypothetical protein